MESPLLGALSVPQCLGALSPGLGWGGCRRVSQMEPDALQRARLAADPGHRSVYFPLSSQLIPPA